VPVFEDVGQLAMVAGSDRAELAGLVHEGEIPSR